MKSREIQTPGRVGDGPRRYNVILEAADTSAVDIRFDEVATMNNSSGERFFGNRSLPSFGVIVVGTEISCVALIFVRPGRPSKAGSKTAEQKTEVYNSFPSIYSIYRRIVVLEQNHHPNCEV